MRIDRIYKSGVQWFGFWRRKMGYLGRAAAIILFMSRQELVLRWAKGEKEHGKMTDEQLREFDAMANLRQELQDGYWYNHIYNEQRPK